MKDTTIELIPKLEKYFQAKVIGSYLLVGNGLELDDISDVDLLIHSKETGEQLIGIRSFLSDQGYIETKGPTNRPGYKYEQGSLIFEKEGSLNIDLSIDDENVVHPWDIDRILYEKIQRGSISDLNQCMKVISHKIQNMKA